MPAELEDFSDEDDEEFKPDVRLLPHSHLWDRLHFTAYGAPPTPDARSAAAASMPRWMTLLANVSLGPSPHPTSCSLSPAVPTP